MQNPATLGELLLAKGLVNPARVEAALATQTRSGGKLGQILLAEGAIAPLPLHHAIAEHLGLPFANLVDSPADAALQKPEHLGDYIRLQAIPYKREADGTLVIAACSPDDVLAEWTATHYGAHRFAVTSPYDLYWHIDTHFADVLDEHSRLALWNLAPEQSARQVLNRSQKRESIALLALLAVALYFYPSQMLYGTALCLNLFYFFALLLKGVLFYSGLAPNRSTKHPAVDTADLPVYTVLVPLHDEAESLPRLLDALDALDYPKAKLDIKLIVERSDSRTIDALKALRPRGGYQLIHVPYSLPQTKPKACNYALHFARGEFVTIYDAEDAPDPQQLRKAVAQFRASPPDVVCLQARLNYYNRDRNLLTGLFALEYASWFDHMLPGLEALRIPIPLGGTSNHFRLANLRAAGEWDPFNVTEDADLGIRIAMRKQRTAMLDSLTLEEAPARLKVWMAQRTRWVRGYMQTWLVHMRDPLALMRNMSAQAFWGFQFFVGGPCLVFLTAPFLWLFSIAWFCGLLPTDARDLGAWLLPIALFNLSFGLVLHLGFAVYIILRNGWGSLWATLPVLPFYWLLHSWAAYRAIWQLYKNPHFWEKTPHGENTTDN
ncbi:MAG: glycosyltransferase [Alphaproteobacteria bacterium]|nr:glycosyltransferase [Alphaproteobacteria bacterium]